jgi:probable F420-dependent oxidoreductase
MKVGVNLLNFGPGATPEALLGWAQQAEALGYHSVMISDHVAITPSVRPRYPEPYYDAFATLSWLAGQTQRVLLGTTVAVLPYRHPILTARLVANIDQLSGGRFILGVGVGNAEDEFASLGQPHKRRGALSHEGLAASLALWTGVGPGTFDGRLVNFQDVSSIETRQKPHPPVWIGGRSEAAFRRTVRFGDAWHPILRSIEWVEKEGLPELRITAEREQRPVPRFCPRIGLDVLPHDAPADRIPGVGSLPQIKEDFERLAALGAEHVILDWNTRDLAATREHERGWASLEALARDVLDLAKEQVR